MNHNKDMTMETIQIREVSAKYKMPRMIHETIREPAHAANFIRKITKGEAREHFIVIHLDSAHKPCGYSISAIGTANSCPVAPREIFQSAILAGAVAIIIAHNHPSGNSTPSDEDRKVTKKLRESGDIIGIKVLDHIVVTDSDFSSAEVI